ncbi:MAG: hypothetical protein AAF663_07550 [Planctomycetota bacterium]
MSTLTTELRDVATELIGEEGRSVTLRREAKATPEDAAKPWHGYQSEPSSDPITAAFFTPDSLIDSGMRFAKGSALAEFDVMAFVAGDAATGEINPGASIVDGDDEWAVHDVDETRPGTVRTHWVLGLKQGAET